MFEVISIPTLSGRAQLTYKAVPEKYGSGEPSAGNQLVALTLERFVFHVTFSHSLRSLLQHLHATFVKPVPSTAIQEGVESHFIWGQIGVALHLLR